MALNLTDLYRSSLKRTPKYIENLPNLEDYCFSRSNFDTGKNSLKWFILSIQDKVEKREFQIIWTTTLLEINILGECYSDVTDLYIFRAYKRLLFHNQR